MTFKALAIATALVTVAGPTFAMTEEVNQLTGKLYNELRIRGISTDGIENLTMTEILRIQTILSNGDSNGEMVSSVNSILQK